MKRNKKGAMSEITREKYKNIKKYDRQQFMIFCANLYGYGYEDGMKSVPIVDVETIIAAIASIRKIGSGKLKDIRSSVEAVLEGGGKA